MTPQLEAKLEAALSALRSVHSDTSGPASDTLEAIQTIKEEAEMIIDALESDLED